MAVTIWILCEYTHTGIHNMAKTHTDTLILIHITTLHEIHGQLHCKVRSDEGYNVEGLR